MAHKKRPEHTLPPDLYYDENEAYKYTSNSHIIDVQTKLSERALELLALPDDEQCTLLDIGCGSGLSGEVITDNGHYWVGIDISKAMLDVAVEREVEGHLVYGDIGLHLPFRSGSFDGAISISAVQWLCNAEKSSHNPVQRIRKFFSSLYASLARGARAVIQFYPESVNQLDLLQNEALRAGFTGGLIVDFPHSSKAKKYFLVLDVDSSRQMPSALTQGETYINHGVIVQGTNSAHATSNRGDRRALSKHSVGWIKQKKERAKLQMKKVANDSRYTGRKRKPKF